MGLGRLEWFQGRGRSREDKEESSSYYCFITIFCVKPIPSHCFVYREGLTRKCKIPLVWVGLVTSFWATIDYSIFIVGHWPTSISSFLSSKKILNFKLDMTKIHQIKLISRSNGDLNID